MRWLPGAAGGVRGAPTAGDDGERMTMTRMLLLAGARQDGWQSSWQLAPFPLATYAAQTRVLATEIADDQCAVCLEAMLPSERVLDLRCGHTLHWGCIEPWLVRKRSGATCPKCKTAVLSRAAPAARPRASTEAAAAAAAAPDARVRHRGGALAQVLGPGRQGDHGPPEAHARPDDEHALPGSSQEQSPRAHDGEGRVRASRDSAGGSAGGERSEQLLHRARVGGGGVVSMVLRASLSRHLGGLGDVVGVPCGRGGAGGGLRRDVRERGGVAGGDRDALLSARRQTLNP